MADSDDSIMNHTSVYTTGETGDGETQSVFDSSNTLTIVYIVIGVVGMIGNGLVVTVFVANLR